MNEKTPKEIFFIIFNFLEPKDVFNMFNVSMFFHHLSNNKVFWRNSSKSLYRENCLVDLFIKTYSFFGFRENWRNVETINFEHRGCVDVPKYLDGFPKLTHLNLGVNKIETVSQRIMQATSLRVLDLRSNHVKTFPKEIENLFSLKALYLEFNKMTTIPENLFLLPSLEYLILSNNNLTTISENISKLTNLTSIDLSHNEIKTCKIDLPFLQKMNLSHNKISDYICVSSSLRELNLSCNPVVIKYKFIGKCKIYH